MINNYIKVCACENCQQELAFYFDNKKSGYQYKSMPDNFFTTGWVLRPDIHFNKINNWKGNESGINRYISKK